MKLAISNIAWERHDDPEILGRLRDCGLTGIEVAPTRVWPDWQGAAVPAAREYARRLSDAGFSVPAFQAILFGRPDLRLFDPSSRAGLRDHLARVADLAAAMGAKVLVFGAPRNRIRGSLPMAEAMDQAVEALTGIGHDCAGRGVCLGLEPNPVEYGCDFITRAAEARELVDRVGSPGVQLHLDSGGQHLCGGGIDRVIREIGPFAHYHASEPMLAPLSRPVVDHRAAARALREIGYAGWVSIEMKPVEDPLFWSRDLPGVVGMLREGSTGAT